MTQSFVRVTAAEAMDDYRVRIQFSNGEERILDLEPYLHGPIFEAVRRDASIFRQLAVDAELGTIVWPNGADIDPDVLYRGLDPAWQTDTGRADEAETPYSG